jgi:abortive infection bacteriophage resistance protein
MVKPALAIHEQIELLVQRGLPVPLPSDPDWGERQSEYHAVMRLLVDNNYYRLSGYWRYFQVNPGQGNNQFAVATTMGHIETAYTFDNQLRAILSDGLSVLEVTFRSRFAYFCAMNMPADSYLDSASYTDRKYPDGREIRGSLIVDIGTELNRSKERFVTHHRTSGDPVPVWAAVEVLSFGTVSKMYGLLEDRAVRTGVSKSFGLPNPQFTTSVIRSLVVLRNICAHHSRLWNRVPDVPTPVLNRYKSSGPQAYETATPWAWFVMLAHLVDTIRRDDSYSTELWGTSTPSPRFSVGTRTPGIADDVTVGVTRRHSIAESCSSASAVRGNFHLSQNQTGE